MTKHKYVGLFMAALLVGLCGCAGSGIPDAKPTVGRNPLLAETPQADETVRGDEDPSVVTLELGSALHEHRLSQGDELPGNIIIPTTNLNAVPITAALQAVLSGTDISLSWDTGTLGTRLVTVMNLSGPLPQVVSRICSAGKVFCAFRHGAIELAEKETFIVTMPPIAKAISSSSGGSSGGGSSSTNGGGTNSMVEAITELVGNKVQVDDQGGNIIYTTDVQGEEHVSRYLEQLRNGRPLIILQLYVWEVTLNKENSEGVNWSKFDLSNIGPGFSKLALAGASAFASSANTTGNVSVGAVTTGRLNTDFLFNFLSTQGRVQTVSNPQVTFVSGSNAEFKIGGKLRYISQVGQLVAANNTSGTNNSSSTAGVGTNTVNTDSIDTGLTIDVGGAFENGVVFANLDLNLTNLVSLNPTTTGGETIDLPQTTDERVSTVIRVRPGDNLVMAGLVASNDTNTRQGIPLPANASLPMYGDDQNVNRELVVVVKPSVILFSDKTAQAETKRKQEGTKPLPAAVLIDGSGSKTISLPSAPAYTNPASQSSTTQTAPAPTPVGPSQTTTDSDAMGISPISYRPPISAPASAPNSTPASSSYPIQTPTLPEPLMPATNTDANAAPVDQRMMQRGFSHAFDQMLGNEQSHQASSYEVMQP